MYSDFEDLFAAGEQVHDLLAHPGWRHVALLLHAEVAEIDRMLDGRDEPLTQAEYAMHHGRRSGSRFMEDAATALIAQAEKERARQAARHEGAADAVPERV